MSKDTTDDETLREEVLVKIANSLPMPIYPDEWKLLVNNITDIVARHVQAAKKEQSAATSAWIVQHIRLLQKDPQFKETTASVAFTYAVDQAGQGCYKALQAQPLTDKDSV